MKLVIDLGMHNAADTEYYLMRGHRVVALEPNPGLVREATARLAKHIKNGSLTIVPAALARASGEASFFLSNANSEWSSLEDWRAGAQGGASEIKVRTTTLAAIVAEFGDPHYIKCDIEGADGIFCEQLQSLPTKPDFVSVEAISIDWLALLFAAGYRHFQLINQAKIRRFQPTISFKTGGEERQWTFGGHSSGPFGEDLENAWLPFQETAERWLAFHRLKREAPDMVLDNWFDFHAKR